MITLKIDRRIWTSTISSFLKVTIEDPPIPERKDPLFQVDSEGYHLIEEPRFGKSKD